MVSVSKIESDTGIYVFYCGYIRLTSFLEYKRRSRITSRLNCFGSVRVLFGLLRRTSDCVYVG